MMRLESPQTPPGTSPGIPDGVPDNWPRARRSIRPVRFALMLPLVVFGLVLLATPALPLGLAMIGLGVWQFERRGHRGSDGFITLLMILGGLGALAVFAQFIWQRLTA